MDDIKYWLAFRRIPQLGTARFRRLESFFGKLEKAWTASLAELMAAGLDDRTARLVDASRKDLSPDDELEKVIRA